MALYRLKKVIHLVRNENGKPTVAKRFEEGDVFLVIEKFHSSWKDHDAISFKLLSGNGIYNYYVFDMEEFLVNFEEV
jgi:hypothetical protein